MSRSLNELQKKFKRGWYRKGNSFRFLHALNDLGMLIYQTKTNAIKSSKEFVGVNPDYDTWFDKAEYVGFDLPEQTKKD